MTEVVTEKWMRIGRKMAGVLVGGLLGACAHVASAAGVDFDREMRPIFSAQCYSCHGPEKHKGGLRLDDKAAAMAGGTSGAAILVGKGEESPLVKRLRGVGDDDQMPLKKPPLPAAQIALVSRWIDEGAHWPENGPAVVAAKHWSFVAPVRPAEPAVKNAAWVRNPIDRFVLARLEKEGLSPSPEAPKETLLRRVSLDLTGLPPSPAEVDQFLSDLSPNAYEKAVDRLLASPHYGERWARHWLDGARYADSNGYSIDSPRSIWPYRDWVINALNADMPFDEFAIEQLAGDLLPNATVDQKIATGFHRNTQINEEGGIDPEQFRVESVIDRVGTTGTVFLGLTVACAQCHNHKFDPIAQKDFYRLFAFFNNCDEPKTKLPGAKEGTTTLVVQERKVPRQSWLFIKGDFTRHGEEVTPGVPAILPPLNVEHPTRLDLAKWIVDPANPLTARVQVNRLWLQYFGRGIVETDNDFGSQGSPPSHPELLDYLATELVRQHWSLKAIHRLIVTSSTYRQSSRIRPELKELDPYNHLLARQSRIRLDAEVVRDVELVASGLLAEKVGGPSVYPPQPEGVLNLGQVRRTWKTSTGPDRYRRGLYTFVWRMTPHPLLTAFDAPDATLTCTRRNRSNTPLQALTLLNDAAFAEFAEALSERIVREGPSGDAGRIDYAFRLSTSRKPFPDEAAILLKVLEKERGNDPWLIVSRILLNLDETITRE
jgi:mono/diheme cytochrome c family protein